MATTNKKKYYGTLATIGVVGGVTVLAYVVLKKPKLVLKSIDENFDGDKLTSKTYNVKLGFRDLKIESTPFNSDEIDVKSPLYTYNFKTVRVLDESGFQRIEVTIKNRLNSKEEKMFLDAL